MLWLIMALGVGPAWPADDELVTLNFVDSEIEGVVKLVSEITGKNFVLDPRVKGTVNIVSAQPIPRALVYDVFLSALRLQGFAAIDEGNIVKIVPEAEAKLHPGSSPGQSSPAGGRGDQIETRVFTLKHESAVQTLPLLRPLISPNNTITADQSSNTLVITDYAGNLPRLARIISSIDQPRGSDPVVIPMEYASAIDIAATVNRLFEEASQAQGTGAAEMARQLTVAADARSNSLLVRSDDPSRLARIRRFVALLDAPTKVAGNIHVVQLKNAEAVDLADTLRAIYHGDGGDTGESNIATAAHASLGASAMEPSQAAGGRLSSDAGRGRTGPKAPGIIQADAATNSIIITAPEAVYNNLRAVVDKLDVRRAQVYVEALIAEITADQAGEFGIQWQDLTGAEKSSTEAFGGTNFGNPNQNILDIASTPGIAGKGLNIGIIEGTVSIPGTPTQILNLGLLVRALESDTNANILSTPTLLTLNNEEASIVIGQDVPFITGQFALTGAAVTPTPFQTIERQDVGLTLRVKPQISEGDTVRLAIYQEVSSVQDQANPAGVITNKRAVSSTVLVDDGQIVVIGGLIQNTVNDRIEQVPILGSLPILGNLFRYETRSYNKTNLMIFLRPTIVRDREQTGAFTDERYEHILEEQHKTKPEPSAVFPEVDPPTLPPR